MTGPLSAAFATVPSRPNTLGEGRPLQRRTAEPTAELTGLPFLISQLPPAPEKVYQGRGGTEIASSIRQKTGG
jgi:hypothetical protein